MDTRYQKINKLEELIKQLEEIERQLKEMPAKIIDALVESRVEEIRRQQNYGREEERRRN